MILLGAGASAPLRIPTMEGFVKIFEEKIRENSSKEIMSLYEEIKRSIERSEGLIDRVISFDLESLMAVLEDLSGIREKRMFSPPTLAFLLSQLNKGNLKRAAVNEVRVKFGNNARKMLEKLRYMIFDSCMKSIMEGEENGSYAFLAQYYGPLFTLFGRGTVMATCNQWVFTTNWDLCLKAWMDYVNLPFEDGVVLDPQKKPVLDISKGWSVSDSAIFRIIPLHGSLDLIKILRLRAETSYEEISRVINPHIYFKDKPGEIERIFMIYPLEAVGYELSVKSPYLDLLNFLKSRLMTEELVFVVGFSFRDSTIASIFEEVLRERIRKGHCYPLGSNLEILKIEQKRLKKHTLNFS
jgi:hypothetical protein